MLEVHILSGGTDSVAVLHRRLVETPNEIHALHVMTNDSYAVAELRASRNAAIWLAKNVRPFVYREIEPQVMTGKACSGNIFAQCGYAVGEYIVRNPAIGLVVQGCNGSPEDQCEESLFRNRYREGICAAVCNGYAPVPQWLYPNFEMTKAEICRGMPPELLEMVWSCNHPTAQGVDFLPCGKCDKCRELAKAKEGM